MIKHRVYFKENGFVEIETVSEKYQNTLGTSNEVKKPQHLINYEYSVFNFDKVPKLDVLESWEQLYHKNDKKIYTDNTWSERLMPDWLIKQKHQTRLATKLDEELAKETPDPVKVIKLQREKELVASWDEKKTYQQALANMDEDGLNKPIIRQKLNDKIKGG